MSGTVFHGLDEMGAQSAIGDEWWVPRQFHSTREKARTFFAEQSGEPWVEIRVLSEFMRHDENAADEFSEYVVCGKDAPGAFPVWGWRSADGLALT